MTENNSLSACIVENKIMSLRGQRIILDFDLATIYSVSTKNLIKAVKRNRDRFPEDFIFQLSNQEFNDLESLLPKRDWGGRRYLPYAFTEHGAVMAANILRSKRAVKASIFVVRAFVKLRQFLASHKELAEKLIELERQVGTHDKAIVSMFQAIRMLMSPTQGKRKKIGFIW
ncbi:MAG: ORF6N domain-containing protein [bacterium]